LNNLLSYDPESGVIIRKVDFANNAKAGDEAGWLSDKGYIRMRVAGGMHYAHRVAWLLFYGVEPDGEIDHIDGNRANNQISNLRVVTPIENMRNKKMYHTNYTGISGIFWRERQGRRGHYVAKISGKHIFQGKDFFEACCLRKSAENNLNYHVNHGRNI
jgi:hypothetical protein